MTASTITDLAFTPITLPNGQVLKNRIAKAAMEENMSVIPEWLSPSPELIKLYKTWAEGGAGLVISGNVMVDPRAVGGPAPVSTAREIKAAAAKDPKILQAFKDWTAAATSNGTQFWLQLNHPGRQANGPSGSKILAPSPIAVDIGKLGKSLFFEPKELTEEEILDIIQRFAESSQFAEEIGATGVEIHASHGYLVSQFLSPLVNKRQDRWGGSLENRAAFLFEIIKAVRAVVSPSFAVGVKINSADFQRGGFSEDDAEWVVKELGKIRVEDKGGVDLVEISGGSYESPAMGGEPSDKSESTVRREAYFLDFAQRVSAVATVPLMVTGGIKRREIVDLVVAPAKGADSSTANTIAGLGTALGLMPDLPNRLERGEDPHPHLTAGKSWVLPATLAGFAKILSITNALRNIGAGRQPNAGISPLFALVREQWIGLGQTKQYKALSAKIDASA